MWLFGTVAVAVIDQQQGGGCHYQAVLGVSDRHIRRRQQAASSFNKRATLGSSLGPQPTPLSVPESTVNARLLQSQLKKRSTRSRRLPAGASSMTLAKDGRHESSTREQ